MQITKELLFCILLYVDLQRHHRTEILHSVSGFHYPSQHDLLTQSTYGRVANFLLRNFSDPRFFMSLSSDNF
jgi:hypothetical protein